MRCDETNRKMKMMVVLCFSFFQARRYGASFGRGVFFHSCVRYRRAEASLSSSWRCGLVEVLSLTLGSVYTIPYHTVRR